MSITRLTQFSMFWLGYESRISDVFILKREITKHLIT